MAGEGRKEGRERERERRVGRRPGYKVTRNSGALFTAWIIDERGVKYERRWAVINAGAELVRSFDSASRVECAGLLAPRLASEQMARYRRHRAYCVTYVTSLCQRNRSFSYSTRTRPHSEILMRMYLLFPLCRYFRKTISRLYFVKFKENRSVHVDAFEYYRINHDNTIDRVLKRILYNVEK